MTSLDYQTRVCLLASSPGQVTTLIIFYFFYIFTFLLFILLYLYIFIVCLSFRFNFVIIILVSYLLTIYFRTLIRTGCIQPICQQPHDPRRSSFSYPSTRKGTVLSRTPLPPSLLILHVDSNFFLVLFFPFCR